MNAPAQPSSEFHLIAIDLCGSPESDAEPGSGAVSSGPVPLVIPSGVSRLVWMNPAQVSLQSTTARPCDSNPLLEPLLSRPNEPRLLVACAPQRRASINGVPAPRLALLTEGDRFHFDAGPAFRVALFHRPRRAAAPAEVIGVTCPVCTLALAEGDRCLVCACGTPLHAAEDASRDGALCCVKMISHCPHCQQPIRLVPGYGELSRPDHD